jgi:hypothetical protein
MSFGDLYTVPAGQGNPPDLPPVDLPQVEAPPRRPLQLTVHPQADPFAGFKPYEPSEPPKRRAEPSGDPFAGFKSYEPSAKPAYEEGGRDITPGESRARGAIEGLTFGAAPALAGLAEAGTAGMPPAKNVEREPGAMEMISGLVRMGYEHFLSPEGKKVATEAYEKGRDELRKTQESAYEQNPGNYIGGQLAGAVAIPIGAGARAATAGGRLLQGIKAGGIGGGLYSGGTAISEGQDPLDVAKSAGLGALTGAGLGVAGQSAVEGIGRGGSRFGNIIQGYRDPQAVAARTVAEAMREAQRTGRMGLSQGEYAHALADQTPVHNIDIGGDPTRRLGRAVSNVSSEAAETLALPIEQRRDSRIDRIRDKVYRLFGGTLDSGADTLRLEQAGRQANRPAYVRAYAAGNRPIGAEPEMQRLIGMPAVQDAMRGAIVRGQNRAGADGFGAFRSGMTVTPDGRLVFNKGPNGIRTYPNIQFWDYVQREMRDAAGQAARAGRNEEAGAIGSLHRQLRDELDRIVPEFGEARHGAAAFFGAQDAAEAGRKFVMRDADTRDAGRAIAKFHPPERELFARNFADELVERLLKNPKWDTINKSFLTPRAREKIEMAIGPARARELEVATRIEAMAKKTEDALFGNSTTARQWSDIKRLAGATGKIGAHGVGVGGAVAGIEALKEGDYDIKHASPQDLCGASPRRGASHRHECRQQDR